MSSEAVILAVADAAVAEINLGTQSWAALLSSQPAQRLYLPIFDLDILQTLQVVVVPRMRQTNALLTRRPGPGNYNRQQTHRLDCFIEQKLQLTGKAADNTLLDPLQLLTQQIESWFLNDQHRLANFTAGAWARCIESMIDPYPSLADLDEDGVYLSIIQMQFEVLV